MRARCADRQGADGPLLRIEIEDTGPGISPDEQDKLFRQFEQTKTGQQAGTGTGLGLAISREFVRLMGGVITVNSQVGKGSVFVIHLPLKEGEAQAVPAKDKPRQVLRLQPGQAACRILIADDIEDNRQLLVQLLAPVGFEIRLATNGAEAVREFEEWRPHLILMDFRMPVMDGHEAIRRIRTMPGGKETKIIAVTASAMEEEPPRPDGDRRRRFYQQAVQGSRAVPEDSYPRRGGVRLRGGSLAVSRNANN